MRKSTYTYEEAILLIKEKIAQGNGKRSKKKEHDATIADFCTKHDLPYFSVVNALNSKKETRPKMVKELLEIVLKSPIKHSKVNIFKVDTE